MRWSTPEQFVWLIPWCFAGGLIWLARTRRKAAWVALGREDPPPGSGLLRIWLSALLLILGLAGPRWGRVIAPPAPPGRDVVLLVDVSRSMAARDADPSRLEVARSSARSLLRSLGRRPGEQAALVVFASRPELRVPMTSNLGAVSEGLDLLEAGEIVPGGTSLAAGLALAVEAFGPIEPADGRAIVVFSDGEDHGSDLGPVLERLRVLKIPVHCVAIGDPEAPGATIPVAGSSSSVSGSPLEPLRYQGEVVFTRREDATLTRIAGATEGAFLAAGLRPMDLGELDRSLIAPRTALARQAIRTRELADRRGIPYLGGLLILIPWLRWLKPRPAPLLVGLTACAIVPLLGAAGVDLKVLAREGLAAFQSRRWDIAASRYRMILANQPRSPLAHYNLAEAVAAQEDFPQALQLLSRARDLQPDPLLAAKIDYALGNTLVCLGRYRDAIASYDRVLELRDARGEVLVRLKRDAAANREFALEQLDRARDHGDREEATRSRGEGESPESEVLTRSEPRDRPPRLEEGEAGAVASRASAPGTARSATEQRGEASKNPPGSRESQVDATPPPGRSGARPEGDETIQSGLPPTDRLQREMERISNSRRRSRAAISPISQRNTTDERPW